MVDSSKDIGSDLCNITIRKSALNLQKFPPQAYNPLRVIDIGIAYKELENAKKGSVVYIRNNEIISNLETCITGLKSQIDSASSKKIPQPALDELTNTYYYMASFKEKAIDLSRRLQSFEEEYLGKAGEENKRYKKKTDKLENNKNRELSDLVEKKSVFRKVGEQLMRFGPALGVYIVSNNFIKQEIISFVLAAVSIIPVDYILNRIEAKKMDKIVDDYEPKFNSADRTHKENLKKEENEHDIEKKKAYVRTVLLVAQEAARFFPKAVEKSKANGDIITELDSIDTVINEVTGS